MLDEAKLSRFRQIIRAERGIPHFLREMLGANNSSKITISTMKDLIANLKSTLYVVNIPSDEEDA